MDLNSKFPAPTLGNLSGRKPTNRPFFCGDRGLKSLTEQQICHSFTLLAFHSTELEAAN